VNHGDNYDNPVPNPDSQDRQLSALPSPLARAIAFATICIAGLAGGAIGYSLVDVQCSGSCQVGTGLGLLVGSLTGAIGMSIVAVLVLRAVGEWREISDQ
jgi:hypothetical protein